MESQWDVIVIGAGAVGENVADRVVRAGLSAVVIESDLVGGECSYWACMPSKALLRSGAALRAASRLGQTIPSLPTQVNPQAVLQRRTSFTSTWDDSSQVDWLANAGIDLIRGHGRITGERRVEVVTPDHDTRELTARRAVVVCTGSTAVVPDLPGLSDVPYWTSRDATSVQEVPADLLIVGGGVVACEMANAFCDLGTRVTVLARSGLLSTFEPQAGDLVTAALSDRGVVIPPTADIESVTRRGDHVVVHTRDEETFSAHRLLVATGRQPRTDTLGIDLVGLTPGDWLSTDDSLRVIGSDGTSTDWLYAAGDVTGRALLTHQGKYQARIAGDAIAAGIVDTAGPWHHTVATADHHAVPQVVFTDPEVATVGMTAAAAHEAGLDVLVLDEDLGAIAGAALHADDYHGVARLVIDRSRETVVGATFVGQDVAELLHAATIAIVGEVPMPRLTHAVPAYPTVSEVWLRLTEAYERR